MAVPYSVCKADPRCLWCTVHGNYSADDIRWAWMESGSRPCAHWTYHRCIYSLVTSAEVAALLLELGVPRAEDSDAVTACTNTDLLRILIENGFNIDAQDRHGSTCLHRAAKRGDRVMAEALLHAGADRTLQTMEYSVVSNCSYHGPTPSQLAYYFGHKELEELIDNWIPLGKSVMGVR